MKFDNNMLPKGFRYDGEKEKNLEVMPYIELKKQYLAIYCHFDGYPEGVGKALLSNFRNYKTILNLILGGELSYITEKTVLHYTAWRRETGVEPKQYDNIDELHDSGYEMEFNYLFKGRKWYWNDGSIEWKGLKDYFEY